MVILADEDTDSAAEMTCYLSQLESGRAGVWIRSLWLKRSPRGFTTVLQKSEVPWGEARACKSHGFRDSFRFCSRDSEMGRYAWRVCCLRKCTSVVHVYVQVMSKDWTLKGLQS